MVGRQFFVAGVLFVELTPFAGAALQLLWGIKHSISISASTGETVSPNEFSYYKIETEKKKNL